MYSHIKSYISLLSFVVVILTQSPCEADILWNWGGASFGGTLTTNGTLPTQAGTYDIIDFEVLVSADLTSFPLGSVSSGTYSETSAGIPMSMTFDWDATAMQPTSWDPAVGLIAEFNTAPYGTTLDRVFFGANYTSGLLVLDDLYVSFLPNSSPAAGSTNNLLIQLTPVVPEPTGIALAGLCLSFLAMRRKRIA